MTSKRGKKGKEEVVSGKDVVACPMCGANVPNGAKECPKCEEPFTPEAFANAGKSRRAKLFFWLGLVLTLGGGGLAMGSWLHDLLDLSVVVEGNSTSFGWLNRLVALIGIIILVIGIIFLILSLSKMETEELKDMELSEEKEEQGG